MLDFLIGAKLLFGVWWIACILLKDMAGTTRPELATSAVTVVIETVTY
jgi:hypothetical protein